MKDTIPDNKVDFAAKLKSTLDAKGVKYNQKGFSFDPFGIGRRKKPIVKDAAWLGFIKAAQDTGLTPLQVVRLINKYANQIPALGMPAAPTSGQPGLGMQPQQQTIPPAGGMPQAPQGQVHGLPMPPKTLTPVPMSVPPIL